MIPTRNRSLILGLSILFLGLYGALPALALPERLALGSGVELDLRATTGVLIGTSHEIVYDQSVSTNYILSQLDWDLKPLSYYGLGLRLQSGSGFFTDLALRSGLSGRSGSIMDSDYLNLDGVKTHLSVSDNYTEDALLADLSVGGGFSLAPGWKLQVYGAINYMHFKFTARDGYYQYGTPAVSTDPYLPYYQGTAYYLYGSGIILQQDFLAISLGVNAEWTPRPNVVLSASFLFSPLVSATALDNHVVRALDFEDTMSKGLLFEPRIGASWTLTKRSRFNLDLSYRLITGLIGDEVITATTGNPDYPAGSQGTSIDAAGAAFEALDISLSLSMSL